MENIVEKDLCVIGGKGVWRSFTQDEKNNKFQKKEALIEFLEVVVEKYGHIKEDWVDVIIAEIKLKLEDWSK